MDNAEYLPLFLAETREHLQELGLAVVRIEERPDDTRTVDEIFRIAHSLKGMAATMGFAHMAALTHAMEDVFELLRQRAGGLQRSAVDVLMRCLDALEAAVESIDAAGEEGLDEEGLVGELRSLVRPRTPEQERDLATGAAAPAPRAAASSTHVRVSLSPDTAMPSVRAYMALSALADHATVVTSRPGLQDVAEFTGRRLEAWIDGDVEAARAAAAAVPEVTEVTVVAEAEPAPPPTQAGRRATSVRVDAERLDALMHHMGELVVHRTHVEALAAGAGVPGLAHAVAELARSSHALQTMVMQVRMIPVEAVFLRFPRLVRDLASKLSKQVELVLVGQDTELDRSVVDALGDPLVHLVRNALDHGLEPPEERLAAGKPATGRLEIAARHAGGGVVITVSDDGRGVDSRRVAARAAERGLLTPEAAAELDAARAVELLFAPGFSTAEKAGDISGRGVGMDAVRTTIRELGGDVLVRSRPGEGTSAEIRLPLTLAIVAALLVRAGGQPFAIPLDHVERTLRLTADQVRPVGGRPLLSLRDGVLPVIDAAAALGRGPGAGADYGVVVRARGERVALAVTELVGQRELVARPLPAVLGDRTALAGGAVLSNGEIALIVDCDALAN